MGHTKGKLETSSYEGGWDCLRIDNEIIFKLALNNPDNAARAALCWNSHDALLEACEAWERAIKHGDLKTIDLGTEMLADEAIEKTRAAIAGGRREVMAEKNTIVSSGMTFGCALAIVISWSLHKSVLWAILHGICSWFYVIYYLIVE